jgi:hypothetical protein
VNEIMSYPEWCADQERFYDTMPLWYWSATQRMERYHAYYEAAKAWNTAQERGGDCAGNPPVCA